MKAQNINFSIPSHALLSQTVGKYTAYCVNLQQKSEKNKLSHHRNPLFCK